MILRGLGTSAAIFAAYVATFGVLALPWLRVASHAAPYSALMHPADERLVVCILGWVATALASHALHVFDAYINFPAPAQLGSIEHLFGTQLLFAIPFGMTDNAVLATNTAVFLSYPLAAMAMDRL